MQFTKTSHDESAEDTPKPKRHGGCLLKLFIWLVVIPFILIACLPLILSTAPVRNFALNIINSKLGADVELKIDNWSFGWFTQQRIQTVYFRDRTKQTIAHIDAITIDRGLFSLLPIGEVNLGKITLDTPYISCALPPPQKPAENISQTKTISSQYTPTVQVASEDHAAKPTVIFISTLTAQIFVKNGEISLNNDSFIIKQINSEIAVTTEKTPDSFKLDCSLGGGRIDLNVKTPSFMDFLGDDKQRGKIEGSINIKNLQLPALVPLIEYYTQNKWIHAGVFNGSVKFSGNPFNDLTAEGNIAANTLSLISSPTAAHPSVPANVTADFSVQKTHDTLIVQRAQLTSPWANLSAAVRSDPQNILAAIKLGASLPAIARDFGPLLKLSDALVVQKGTLTAELNASGTREELATTLTANTSDLALSVNNTPLKLTPSPSLNLKALLRPARLGASEIETLTFKSPFAEITGSGNMEKASLKASLDLSRFSRDFGKIVTNLPPLYGSASLDLDTYMESSQHIRLKSAGSFKDIVAELKPGKRVIMDHGTATFDTNLMLSNETKLLGVENAQAKLAWDGSECTATWQEFLLADKSLKGFAASFKSTLPTLRKTAGAFVSAEVWSKFKSFEGNIIANVTAEKINDKASFKLSSALQQLKVATKDIQLIEHDIRLNSTGTVDLKAGALQLKDTACKSKLFTADIPALSFVKEPLQVKGNGTATLNLGQLDMSAAPGRPTFKGTLTSKFSGEQDKLQLDATLTGFEFSKSNQVVFVEKNGSFNTALQFVDQGKTIRIDSSTLNSTLAKMSASGTIRNPSSTCETALKGNLGINFAEVTKLLHAKGQDKITMSGFEMRPFSLGGNLMPAPKEFMALGKAEGSIYIGNITATGLNLSAADLHYNLNKGLLKITYAPACNGGRMNITPTLTASTTPMVLTFPAGTKLLDNVGITQLFASDILTYINPLLKNLGSATGTASLTLNQFSTPLGEELKTGMTFDSQLELFNFGFTLGGVFTQLGDLMKLGNKTLGFTHHKMRVACRNGRVYPDPMVFSIVATELRCEGSIGLDNTVDSKLSFGLSEPIVGSQLYPFAKGTIISIPIKGTLNALEVNFSDAQNVITQIGKNLIKNVLQQPEKIGDALQNLFKKK